MSDPTAKPPGTYFCIRNPTPASRRALEQLGCTPHDCLQNCRRCINEPFVTIFHKDGSHHTLHTTTHDELIQLVATQPQAPAQQPDPDHPNTHN